MRTGAPRIDRRIRLNEILELLDSDVRPVQAADDPGGHGLADTRGITNGEDEIADFEPTRVPERDPGEPVRRHRDHGEVEIWVAANPLRLQHSAIGERHCYVVRMLEDVIIGDDKALLRVVDDAGADAVYLARLAPSGLGVRWDAAPGLDADHSRSDFLENRRKRGNDAPGRSDRRRVGTGGETSRGGREAPCNRCKCLDHHRSGRRVCHWIASRGRASAETRGQMARYMEQ